MLFTSQFQLSNTYVLYVLKETEPKLSPSWNPKIICEPHPQFPEPVSSSMPFEPVQVGCLSGRLELSVVLKQNEAMPGAKVGTSKHLFLFWQVIKVLHTLAFLLCNNDCNIKFVQRIVCF